MIIFDGVSSPSPLVNHFDSDFYLGRGRMFDALFQGRLTTLISHVCAEVFSMKAAAICRIGLFLAVNPQPLPALLFAVDQARVCSGNARSHVDGFRRWWPSLFLVLLFFTPLSNFIYLFFVTFFYLLSSDDFND